MPTVWVDDDGNDSRHQDPAHNGTCPWLIEVASGHPEPDSYADTIRHVECGAPLRPDGPDGEICEAGHQFGNLATRFAPFGPEWEREQTAAAEEGYGYR